MRIRNATLTLLALGIVAIVVAREWHSTEPKPVSVAGTAPPAAKPELPPATTPAPVELKPSGTDVASPPPAMRPKMSEQSPVPVETAKQTEVAPQPRASESQVDNPQGTTNAPGDPLAQPENPSEQFMHSRRGDGQHSE